MSQQEQVVHRARSAFRSGKTRSLDFRKLQLKNLLRFLTERSTEIAEALKKDLGKSELATELFEVLGSEGEVLLALEQLDTWAAPRPVEKTLLTFRDQVYVQPQPLGLVLIIGAWNYPWAVTLQPLVGAIAAGNAAVIKPSEVSSHSAKAMEELLPLYLDQELYPVVCGGVSETQDLLRLRWDHIFYTGSSSVGRLVMEAAAAHLTPVTLELGGKSPCYVHHDCNLRVAARRITWGKFVNCGQTCIAPDYVLCDPSIQNQLLQEIQRCIREFYTEDPQSFQDYGRIINQRHFQRIRAMMEADTVAVGGDCDQEDCYISPTVLQDVSPDSKLMQEEIFGPVLPIVPVPGLDQAIQFINDREKPLVLYVFTEDQKVLQRMLAETSSGALVSNDCLVHFTVSELPFGGVGHSGTGSYKGRHTFERLSHLRSVLLKSLSLEAVNSMRYPPHSQSKLRWARLLLLTLTLRRLRAVTAATMVLGLAAFIIQRFLVRSS
ncbi:unnamed protein product [Knipowitschia caucasica]